MKRYVHYVNAGKSGIYGKDVFVDEAKKIGVNRAFPANIAKTINYGDKIYLAIYKPKQTGKLRFQNGEADVFGYFTVDSINVSGNIKNTFPGLLAQTIPVKRSCGSYVISLVGKTTKSVKEVISEIQATGEPFKLFLSGKFHDFNTTLTSINFSRSVVSHDILDIQTAIQNCIKEIRQIDNYQRRT